MDVGFASVNQKLSTVLAMKYSPCLCLLCALLLSACAATKPAQKSMYHKVGNKIPRQSSLGFAISPPSGEGWFERLKDDSLIYLKRTEKDSYSIFTQATEISLRGVSPRPDSLASFVRQRKAAEIQAKKYVNAAMEVGQGNPPANCVRYTLSYEDHSVKSLKGEDYVKVANKGILCFNPAAPQHGIELSYQERSLASARITSYRNEGEFFLSSLQIGKPIVK